jgi:hypothetical protein
VLEPEYSLVVQAPDGSTYTILAVNIQGTQNTVEAFIFLDSQPPQGVPLTVLSNGDNPSFPWPRVTAVCFAAGTSLSTPAGQRRVETLAPGDLVLTRDNGPQPVRWIGQRRVTAREIARACDVRLAPVRIRRGAFAPGLPERDLLVSPQHRILVTGWRAELHFGEPEVLVAACHLVDGKTVTVEPPDQGVTYYHVMFDHHEIVLAEGLPAESFRAGPQAMRSIPEAARDEVLALFPELADYPDGLAPARPILSRAEAALVRG